MDYMQRALELARRALGATSPNPSVGAVIVREGRVVGEGSTQPPGGQHAEIGALAMAGEKARDATLYVTLEPCSHHGRTPPCTHALLRAGIVEVHAATQDPYPQVNGSGIKELEAAGVRVLLGEREGEAREVIEAYLKWNSTGLPFVTVKYAMSLDGKIATSTGESRWITGPEARRRAHDLRHASDAVMVGIGTALADDPQLTARDEADRALERQPLRVVVDSGARLTAGAAMLRAPGRTVVATADPTDARVGPLVDAGAEVLRLPGADGQVDLNRLLYLLGQRPITSLLAEGGGILLASLVRQGLVDQVMAFIAPVIIGGREALTPVEGSGAPKLSDALRLHHVGVERLGDDLLVTGYPNQGE